MITKENVNMITNTSFGTKARNLPQSFLLSYTWILPTKQDIRQTPKLFRKLLVWFVNERFHKNRFMLHKLALWFRKRNSLKHFNFPSQCLYYNTVKQLILTNSFLGRGSLGIPAALRVNKQPNRSRVQC